MAAPTLYWLPRHDDWRGAIRAVEADDAVGWPSLVDLARHQLDFLQTDRLAGRLAARFPAPPAALPTSPVRLAALGSSTLSHLLPAISVAALRRDIHLVAWDGDYGQYLQTLLAGDPALDAFAPTAVLLALDARHATAGLDGSAAAETAAIDRLRRCWAAARGRFGASVIQQTILPVLPGLVGSNEHRFPASPARMIGRLNAALRQAADAEGVHLLALDDRVARDGVAAWHDAAIWHRAKQEVSPAAAPVYGDLVARLIAALQGRSAKALVLDLDNTLWGGVVGDDGVDGIVLGQGSALGEAFVAVQEHARRLAGRGIILAVCSKNDEAVATSAFERHPEMVLRRSDIASFVANWDDKAGNIRAIARALNIGLDALVFLDDNPFERSLVRDHLPEVAVPEIPGDDPAAIPQLLADAGYFEAVSVTNDDLARSAQYQANGERAAESAEAVDLPAYLHGLAMRLTTKPFDAAGLARIVQLVNKTNQFNLTTRRITEDGARAVMADPRAFGLQFRLTDRFGDNGIIAVVIGRLAGDDTCVVDTWLMSCRVLGRQVEQATLAAVIGAARRLGARRLVGEYFASAKNGMVRDHYPRLGFLPDDRAPGRFMLDLAGWSAPDTPVRLVEDDPMA